MCSLVSKVTGFRLDDQCLISGKGKEFSYSCHLWTGSGIHPAPGYQVFYFSQEVKRPECVADRAPPSNAEVKNAYALYYLFALIGDQLSVSDESFYVLRNPYLR